jgi:hypothetical protein
MLVSCFSENDDPMKAGEEVGRKLKGAEYSIVFVNYTLDIAKVVKGIRETSGSTAFGCASSYGISDGTLVEKGVCAMGLSSRDLVGGLAVQPAGRGYECGVSVTEAALKDLSAKRERLASVFARYSAIVSNMPEKLAVSKPYFYILDFSDPFSFSDVGLLEGVRSVMNPSVPLFGGDAFGDIKSWKSYQILNEVYSNSTVLGIFATNKSFGFASGASFTLRDRTPYVVTKAKDNTVYELNYRPVLDVYSELTGIGKERLKEERILGYTTGAEHPFVLVDTVGRAFMKYPAMVNDDGSVLFGTKTATGSVLFHARNDRKKIVADAEHIVKEALKNTKEPQALLLFDCWQRLAAMGEDYAKEAEAIARASGGVPVIGFYTMGEHFSVGSYAGHENGSLIAVAIGE